MKKIPCRPGQFPGQVSMEEMTGKAIGVREYARLHGVHPHTILNWIREGKIPYTVKFAGQQVRYLIPAGARPPMSKTLYNTHVDDPFDPDK